MSESARIYLEFDLVELNLLPQDWYEQIVRVAHTKSFPTFLDGKSSTSREPEGSSGAYVFVVPGQEILEELQWLYSLYRNELLALANEHFSGPYIVADSVEASVNLNLLQGVAARYEWHVDSNPLTGLLFVTEHGEEDGGKLVFQLKDRLVHVTPKKGLFILFDARDIPHTVLPLKKDTFRISIPMNYYFKEGSQERPVDLDRYIYNPISIAGGVHSGKPT